MHNQISHGGGAARDSRRTVGRDLCRDGIDVILTFCAYATSYMSHVDDIKTTCGEKTGSPNVQFREHGGRAHHQFHVNFKLSRFLRSQLS